MQRLERRKHGILLQSTALFWECFVILLFRGGLDLTLKYNFSLSPIITTKKLLTVHAKFKG